MSLFLGDIRIKTALTLGIEDITKNNWLLSDILGDTISNLYLRNLYGTQIESCRQWLENNRIYFFLSERDDKIEFPCIIIELGQSQEKESMKRLADLGTDTISLVPNEINRPIPYVVKPATGSYNQSNGVFTFSNQVNLTQVSQGMILVDPNSGNGVVVQGVLSPSEIQLLAGLNITLGNYGIIPKYQSYEAKIGQTFMQENYKITCCAMDQQTILWLHSIAVYSLLRYRQVLLEKDGFAESMITSGKIYPTKFSDAGQVIWCRDIELTGQVSSTFIYQPHRLLENIVTNGTPPNSDSDVYQGGIKILSNLNDDFEDLSTVNWSTIEETDS